MISAVNWLDKKLQDKMFVEYGYINGVRKIVIPLEDYMRLKQEAIELEKEQLTMAYYIGSQDAPIKKGQSEQYYEQEYGEQEYGE